MTRNERRYTIYYYERTPYECIENTKSCSENSLYTTLRRLKKAGYNILEVIRGE